MGDTPGRSSQERVSAGGPSDTSRSPLDPVNGEKTEMSGGGADRDASEQPSLIPSTSNGTARRPPSEEQKARSRFLSKFRKNKDEEPAADPAPPSRRGTGMSRRSLKHKKFTLRNQLEATILNSWINIFILAAPVGIALYYVGGISPGAIFAVNFIAIIPLAALLSYATEEISLRIGEVLGGLLNATFGNAVELIVAILALVKGPSYVIIVQTSLIGSMLSNLLLVMGMCFMFGSVTSHFSPWSFSSVC